MGCAVGRRPSARLSACSPLLGDKCMLSSYCVQGTEAAAETKPTRTLCSLWETDVSLTSSYSRFHGDPWLKEM